EHETRAHEINDAVAVSILKEETGLEHAGEIPSAAGGSGPGRLLTTNTPNASQQQNQDESPAPREACLWHDHSPLDRHLLERFLAGLRDPDPGDRREQERERRERERRAETVRRRD